MTRSRLLLGILLPAVIFAGCTKTTHPADVKGNEESFTDQGRIQFEKSSTHLLVRAERVDAQRLPNGLLKLTVTLRNKRADNFWVEVRTTFLDNCGHVLEQTNWEPILLDSRTVTEYTCTSMGNQAADYQVIIRHPKKN